MIATRLSTAPKIIAVTNGHWRPAFQPALFNPAQAFVERLWARYGRLSGSLAPGSMIWRHDREAAATPSFFQHHTALHLTPRLNLTVLQQAATAPAQPKLKTVIRGRRVEAGGRPPARRLSQVDQSPAAPSIAPVKPVAQTVRRQATPPPASQPATRPNPDQPQFARQNSFMQDQPPLIDVNQLTQQVVKTIDQRIIAERERLGRL
jgi:hypothetical protein